MNFYKSRKWQRGILIALCVILALFFILLCFVTGYVNYLLGRMNLVNPDTEETLSASEADNLHYDDSELETLDPDNTGDIVHIDEIDIPSDGDDDNTQPLEVITGDHLVNILLVGQDRRENEGRQRSDTMILVTFNKSTGNITLTSFMRDQYVSIPGYKPNKLNAAYQFGGMKLLTKTLLANFGVSVDGIIEVDFGGFEEVINLVGGIDIKLTSSEVEYFNATYDWGLEKGTNHLTGKQALAYARLRSIDTDYRRAERQRNVVTALINSCKQLSLTQLLNMMDEILPLVTTNLSRSEIISYATDLFPMLAGSKLKTFRIPVDGSFEYGIVEVRNGLTAWFQYNIDFYANNQAINEIFKKAE